MTTATPEPDVLGAIVGAEEQARAAHEQGTCHESEWSCSYCEAASAANDEYRTFYRCPSWCVRDDHQADIVDLDSPAVHHGPDFGQVGVQERGGVFEALVYLDGEASFVSDPAELRRVSAALVQAAEWMEAQR